MIHDLLKMEEEKLSFADDLRSTAEKVNAETPKTCQEACIYYIRNTNIAEKICQKIELECQKSANCGYRGATVCIEDDSVRGFCHWEKNQKGIKGIYTRLTTMSPNQILDMETRPIIERYCAKLGIEFVSICFEVHKNPYLYTYHVTANFRW